MRRFDELCNDVLFEIFDYLDVLHLFNAFFNLNRRFHSLIVDRRICFQANMTRLKTKDYDIYRRLILPRVGRYLRYLSISDDGHYLQEILRSIRMETLLTVRLYQIGLNELKTLLQCSQLKSMYIESSSIQNESHLNGIFQLLFNQQRRLRSMECRFDTHLFFIDQAEQRSTLTRVVLHDSCFSSDLITHCLSRTSYGSNERHDLARSNLAQTGRLQGSKYNCKVKNDERLRIGNSQERSSVLERVSVFVRNQ